MTFYLNLSDTHLQIIGKYSKCLIINHEYKGRVINKINYSRTMG